MNVLLAQNIAEKNNGAVMKIVPGKNDVGEHIFSVIVKRSYRMAAGGSTQRCDYDQPLRMIDEYYDGGDPEWSTVQHESELAPCKSQTDVVVIGAAYAPGGGPTEQMMVGVRVGPTQKVLAVTGDRHCHYRIGGVPEFSDPTPFTSMEIRYDRAYGGRDEKSIADIPFHYPRNPMGKGVVMRNFRQAVEGLALPNIEAPQDMMTPERIFIHEPGRWHLQPLPQGLGWRQRQWYPRSALLGIYPPFLDAGTTTAEERMGLLPHDHVALAKQSRLKPLFGQFANGASFGLTFADLRGDEPITLQGLTEDGAQQFSLPNDTPTIVLDIGLGEQQAVSRLHTVSMRVDDREFDMIWCGSIVYEGYEWLPKMTRLHAEVQ